VHNLSFCPANRQLPHRPTPLYQVFSGCAIENCRRIKGIEGLFLFGGGEQPVGGYWLPKDEESYFLINRIQEKDEEISKEV
jgi:hypothetical protein